MSKNKEMNKILKKVIEEKVKFYKKKLLRGKNINSTYLEFLDWFLKSGYVGYNLEIVLYEAWSNAKLKYNKKDA